MKRYTQTSGALVETFDTLDGKPTGQWVEFKDVEVLLAELNLLRSARPEVARRPVGWVVAVGGFAEGTLRVYGPHYRTREAAEQDADLIKARGEQVEVWDCFAASPLAQYCPHGMSASSECWRCKDASKPQGDASK